MKLQRKLDKQSRKEDNMILKIKSIKYEDFKGVLNTREFKFSDGLNQIKDKNGVGKTTILDAIYWTMFGKSFDDRKKFNLFPLDQDNNAIPGKYPNCKLTIERDGQVDVLCRFYKGKVVHTTINEMPYKVNEFAAWVSESIGLEKTVKMLIQPLFFFELDVKSQRAVFMDFFELPKLDDVIKVMKNKPNKKFMQLIASSPLEKLIDWSHNEVISLKDKISENAIRIENYQREIDVLSNNTYSKAELTAKKERLEIEIKKNKILVHEEFKKQQAIENTSRNIMTTVVEIDNYDSVQKTKLRNLISILENDLSILEATSTEMKNQCTLIKEQKIVLTCKTCNQPLNKEGVKALAKRENKKVSKIQTELRAIAIKIRENIAETTKYKKGEINIDPEDGLKILKEKLENLKVAKEGLPNPINIKPVDKLREELSETTRLLEAYVNMAKYKVMKSDVIRANIKLATERELTEIVESDSKAYSQAQATIVTTKVNTHFKTIHIEVLEKLKNGSFKDSFIITQDGVPFSEKNTAGKLMASIELSRFIAEKKSLDFPILIDNFERYPSLDLSHINSQLIVCEAEDKTIKRKGKLIRIIKETK